MLGREVVELTGSKRDQLTRAHVLRPASPPNLPSSSNLDVLSYNYATKKSEFETKAQSIFFSVIVSTMNLPSTVYK
jgi:hypothetical protein